MDNQNTFATSPQTVVTPSFTPQNVSTPAQSVPEPRREQTVQQLGATPASKPYTLEDLESPSTATLDPSSQNLPTPSNTPQNSGSVQPNPEPAPIKSSLLKRVLITGAIVATIIFLAALGVVFLSRDRKAPEETSGNVIPDQQVDLGVGQAKGVFDLAIEGQEDKLIVNGSVVSRGDVILTADDESAYGQISAQNLNGVYSYLLPNATGTFCLDSNNCNYLEEADVTTTTVAGASGALQLGDGLTINGNTIVNTATDFTETAVNNFGGSVTIQGTTNQVNVSNNGGVITLSGPQDLAATSSPVFNTITLTVAGTQNGNEICDISNNCGYAGGTNAFVQNGNSFGETAVLGTNDNENLAFETGGVIGMVLNTDSQVRIGNVDAGFQGALTIASDNQYNLYSSGSGYNWFQGHTAIGDEAPSDGSILSVDGSLGIAGFGLTNNITSNSSDSDSSAGGFNNILEVSNTVDNFSVHGIRNFVTLDSTGDTSLLYGVQTSVTNSGSGDTAILYGNQTSIGHVGSGVVEKAYGNHISSTYNLGTGSITDNYGLYIEDQTGVATNDNYNIYSAGSGYNRFEGHVSIGNSGTPLLGAATLSVVDMITTSGVGIANAIQVNASSGNGDNTAILNELNTVGAEDYDSSVGLQSTIRHSGTGTTTTAIGLSTQVLNENTGTIALATGMGIGAAENSGGGTITDNYGVYVQGQNAGTNNYGIRIDTADTQTLWLAGDEVNEASGIAFGSTRDTNLYRSAANVLRTDSAFSIGTLAATDNASYLCLNSGGIVAGCSGTATGAAFVQGGNSFGTTATLGTNDAQSLAIETGGTTKLTIANSGYITHAPTTSTSTTPSDESAHTITFSDTGAVTTAPGGTADNTRGLNVTVSRSGASGAAITNSYAGTFASVGDLGGTSTAAGIFSYGVGGDTNVGIAGVGFQAGSNMTSSVIGVQGAIETYLGTTGGTVSTAYALQGSVSMAGGNSTFTTAAGLNIASATNGTGGTITSNYGIKIDVQTVGASDYGIRIDAADTQTVWISGNADNTTASAGIAFGASRDTNLYRSAADTLKTDDRLDVAQKLQVGGNSSFTQCSIVSGLSTCTKSFEQVLASTETTTQTVGANFATGITPSAATNTQSNRAINGLLALYGTQSFSGSNRAIFGSGTNTTTAGTIALLGGVSGEVQQLGVGSTITEAVGVGAQVLQSNGTITSAYGMRVLTATGTIGTNYGLHVQTQTAGSSDYGIRVDTADTQTLWIAGDAANPTTASAGIAFGSSRDTNLYRSAADTLKTDDSLEVTNKVQIGSSGGTLAQCLNAVALFTCNNTLEQASATTETTVQTYGTNLVTGITPAGATNTVENRALNASLALYGTQSFSSSLGNYSISGTGINATTAGTIALLGGVYGGVTQGGAGSTVVEAFGLQGSVTQAGGTLTTGYGLRILSSTGTIANNYGIHVQTQTSGTTDYGLRVDTADTQTLWIAGNDASATTAAKGIAFGSARDVTLYRGAADQLKTDDTLLILPTSSSTTALNVTTATDYIFTVDSTNGRVGINLGSNNLPTAALDVTGAMRLTGTATTSYSTPDGTPIGTKIALTNFDPGAFGQLIAFGLPSTAASTARAISVFDDRSVAHQPTIAVFNPAENDAIGFSWDGSDALALVKVQTGQLGFQTNAINRGYFDTSNNFTFGNADQTGGYATAPTDFVVRGTGSATVGTAGGNLTVAAGAGASSSTGSSGGVLALQGGASGGSAANNGGNVTIDGGAPSGAGSYGNVILSNSGGNVMVGTNTSGGKLTVSTGSASTTGLQIRGVASQTANLLKLGDSSSNTLISAAPQSAGNQRALFGIYNTLETTPTNYERLGLYADSSNNVFRIESQNGGSGTLRDMVIQGNTGRVGIGSMNSVGYKLDVYEDRASSYAANFFNDGNDQDRNGIRVQAGADDGSGTTTYIDFLDGDGTEVGYCQNNSGTFACSDSSDARTKTNIGNTVVDAEAILNGLRVVDFNRLQNPDGPKITGFIAQEVQALYGQAVTVGSNGYLGVARDQLVPILVRGHQNQETKITNADDRIAALEAQVDDLMGGQGVGTPQTNFSSINVSGAANIATLTVTGSATIEGSLVVEGNARFAGNITVEGHIIGNQDTRGVVTMPAGETEVKHTFAAPYDDGSTPNIILTATNDFAPSYRVESDEDSFTVYFQSASSSPVKLNYQVQQ